jgi:arsenite oxidase small subunit
MPGDLDCPPACPFTVGRDPLFDLPVGQIRRVAAGSGAPGDVDETKRNVLKLAAVAGLLAIGAGGAVGGAIQYLQPPSVGLSAYPKTQLFDVDGAPLNANTVAGGTEYNAQTTDLFLFYYPLQNEPNFFLNLAPVYKNVPGGVGPDGAIVAFSAICQHLGCPAPAIAYYPPGTCPQTPGGKSLYIHCSCHGSTYDPANSASNLTGPAVLPLPQVTLVTDDDGNIFATGMSGPPVNGHLNTLTGDYGVGTTSQLLKETPVLSCNFPA